MAHKGMHITSVNALSLICQLLAKHNYYRRMHNVNDMHLNQQHNEYAQSWAEYLARTDRFEHRRVQRMAESIARTAHSDRMFAVHLCILKSYCSVGSRRRMVS